jgi:hypothetical protein
MCDIREKSETFVVFMPKLKTVLHFVGLSVCSPLPLLFFRYTHAGIVTFPVYLPYFSAQRCMIEIIFMSDIYENNHTLIILLKAFKEYIDSPTIALKNFVIYCRLAPKCKYAHQNLEDQKEYRLKKRF